MVGKALLLIRCCHGVLIKLITVINYYHFIIINIIILSLLIIFFYRTEDEQFNDEKAYLVKQIQEMKV